MKRWLILGLGFLLAKGSALAADPAYYVRRDTWPETMRASREALAKSEEEEAQRKAAAGEPTGPQLGPWYVIGPFPRKGENAFSDVFPPEEEINLEKAYEPGPLRWEKRPEWQDGVVYPLTPGDYSSTYLYRTLTTKAALTLTGYFGSDDGLTVWLNGKKLISNDVPRGPAPNQDIAPLPLQPGENHLLLKVTNITGGYGFYFSTSPEPGVHDPRREAREGLWDLVQRDFTDAQARREMAWEREDGLWAEDWTPGDLTALGQRYAQATRLPLLADQAQRLVPGIKDSAGLQAVRQVYYRARQLDQAKARWSAFPFDPLRRAITDLTETFRERYPHGPEYLARLTVLRQAVEEVWNQATQGDLEAIEKVAQGTEELETLRSEALLSNPLLDFDRLLLVKRRADRLGLPQNWQGNSSLPPTGYENEIAVLSPLRPEGQLTTLFRPEGSEFVGDLDLHFHGDRLLFSMPSRQGRWQVFEIGVDGTGLRQVTPGDQPDVDNFDACYLPNGKIIFCSTACFQGVPCVGGADHVSLLYLMDADGQNVRQLTFDQDHNWCPTVLNNGRVLYTRWEYSDTPHYFSRLLFHSNPDGTEQMEYYGSNSYWPNSTFYARPIPGHPTQVVAIVSGHHGVPRMGELVIFDPARGQREADGVVQRIPSYGQKVPPTIADTLVDGSWPKFLHPYPLSEKYFLVSCQLTPTSPWGIYLVDVFDNRLPLHLVEGYALLEPIPLRARPTPPLIPDKVNLQRQDAIVYLADVYAGKGLMGVPRGTVKRLRVFANHYAYPGMGGHIHIGIDGPWDVKRILGTVPVHEDGSALFRVPANTPLGVQPLDAEGKALQLMRSWFTAMPGEVLSCVGCHEPQGTPPPLGQTQAAQGPPSEIAPWYGPARGFSFEREVQPVLDHYCVTCHNGQPQPDGKAIPDLRAKKDRPDYTGGFTPAYEALHPFVRRPGPESDYHLLPPLEYHADTSELVQMLQKGHQGVQLNPEAWDRLITWIDLNVPCHGTWHEHRPIPGNGEERRRALRKLYAGMDEDPEAIPQVRSQARRESEGPSGVPSEVRSQARRESEGPVASTERNGASLRFVPDYKPERTIALGDGVTMKLVWIPAGEFVMGDPAGEADERPLTRVRFDQPFWMGQYEVTNEQYRRFDPEHDSRFVSQLNKDQDNRGYPLNDPQQPVVRVSWQQAMAFCRWLSERTGEHFTLPTEAQWEYAGRAGTTTPFSFGGLDTDFSPFANLADATLKNMARRDSPDWIPKDARFNDGALVTAKVGRYRPNAWGLYDMHGNVGEWTRSTYQPYPYHPEEVRSQARSDREGPEGADAPDYERDRKVVRGGSWYDRPHRARAAFRLSYPAWQGVYNVGFRVVSEGKVGELVLAGRRTNASPHRTD